MRQILFLLLAVPLFFHGAPASSQERIAELAGDGAVLLQHPDGRVLVSHNPERPLVPASLIKLPLAQVALDTLGEDFRFETHFYVNSAGDLLIRGLGDPFLVSEEIEVISINLHQTGLRKVRRVVMDDSAFEPEPDLPLELGVDDPYAARVSALAANFNTVNLAWTDDGDLVSAESQTPLTPLARQIAAQMTISGGEPQRINLGADRFAGLQQAQQLFIAFLTRAGVEVETGEFYVDTVSSGWQSIYQHLSSRSLQEILGAMLRYSNNFIANQLFLALGAQKFGYPATVSGARTALNAQLAVIYGEGYGLDPASLLMLEGSGLDRRQRTSAYGMLKILEEFEGHVDLIPEFNGVLRKSGTLSGVYNYAGYLQEVDGLYPFVILTNQTVNNRDEILALLKRQI